MASQWLKARQTKYGAYAAIYILVVLAIVVVANMLADRYNKSYDTTSNKRYSLSDQTKKIVGGLKQNATITYFNQSTRFQQGKDVLDQYANLSPRYTSSMWIRIRTHSWRAPLESASSALRWCRSAPKKTRQRV